MNPELPPSAWVRVFLPFALGYYLSYLLRTVNAVISPLLSSELGLSAAALGLLTSAYFLAFAAAQIPVGIALDRYGPRRVEAALLLLAGLGAALFAVGEGQLELVLGRALIGLGVSACLMAALKGIALWYPPERYSSMTAFVMASGALGALTASQPLEAALPMLGWRGVFWLIAALAVVAAMFLLLSLPRAHARPAAASPSEQLRTIGRIYAAPAVQRISLAAVFMIGGFMAVQGLWVVPWLLEVERLDLATAARVLLLLNLGALVGQLTVGFFATRLARRGIGPLQLLQWGWGAMLLVEAGILSEVLLPMPAWFLFGVFSAASSQAYLCAALAFPPALFGRVSTAVNQLCFVGAFALQWGLGLAIDLLAGFGLAVDTAHKGAFLGLLVLQILSLLPLLRMTQVPKSR